MPRSIAVLFTGVLLLTACGGDDVADAPTDGAEAVATAEADQTAPATGDDDGATPATDAADDDAGQADGAADDDGSTQADGAADDDAGQADGATDDDGAAEDDGATPTDDGGAAAGTPGPGDGPQVQATIAQFAYDPDPLEIDAGTTVTWTNTDQIIHTVTAGTPEDPMPELFDIQTDGRGEADGEAPPTASFTFTEPGTYAFFCTRHPTAMSGTLIVR